MHITLANSVVADRFTGTSTLSPEQAVHIGTLGYVARASGIAIDARADHPIAHLRGFPARRRGDRRRARPVPRPCPRGRRLHPDPCRTRATGRGHHASPPDIRHPLLGRAAGLGVVEAWRGTLCHRVEIGASGTVTRVRAVDPSFFNWPALPVALTDTIVPDFPLTNKSFNQSYAGNDL